MTPLRKYPRTPHISGSRHQPGDGGLADVPMGELAGRSLVVEEKIDGANAAMSFDLAGRLLLQSRGHYLTGGARERHFALFKRWAYGLSKALWPVIGDRHVVYGEWVYAKHTIFYDTLPHYFLEFDVLDRHTGAFLDTPSRKRLLAPLPIISVPVLHMGPVDNLAELEALVAPSAYMSPDWRNALAAAAGTPPHRPELVMQQTDQAGLMEGLYIKCEEGGAVTMRAKYVRGDFLTAVANSESHWQTRPILPNRLAPAGADRMGHA